MMGEGADRAWSTLINALERCQNQRAKQRHSNLAIRKVPVTLTQALTFTENLGAGVSTL